MERITAVRHRLLAAGSLDVLLDAAWDGFEDIICVSGTYADTALGFVTCLVYVLAVAADGRDAVITAPSLPARSPEQAPGQGMFPDLGPAVSITQVVTDLAALGDVLATRLAHAASAADDAADQAACRIAARCAGQVHALLAGTQP